ncbi:MAG: DUF4328 domain-containing protein [Actinomycetota bacterium]
MSDLPPPPTPGGDAPHPPSATPPPPPPPGTLTPPPGYVAFQGAPTPSGTLARVGGLRTAIVVLCAVTAAGTLLTALLTGTVNDAAEDYLAGNISDTDFIADYAPILIGQGVQSVGQLALAVITIIWLYRVAKNVRLFGRQTTWAPIWAVFGWILPPVLVIIPFLMVREVWKASDPDTPYGSDSWKSGAESPTIVAWFVVYGVILTAISVAQIGAVFGQGFGGDADTLAESVTDFGGIDLLLAFVTIVSAGLWALVVRQVTARHIRLTGES